MYNNVQTHLVLPLLFFSQVLLVTVRIWGFSEQASITVNPMFDHNSPGQNTKQYKTNDNQLVRSLTTNQKISGSIRGLVEG